MPIEVWHWIGILPLAVVVLRGSPAPYWWMGAAFAVSFLADSVAHIADPLLLSVVYPVSQAALMGIALLERPRDVLLLLTMLVSAGLSAAGLYDGRYPDVLLTTVAFLSVAGIAWMQLRPSLLRESLLLYFGSGCLAWWLFAWTAYSQRAQDAMTVYQVTRLAGIALFCLAVVRPAPRLKVA